MSKRNRIILYTVAVLSVVLLVVFLLTKVVWKKDAAPADVKADKQTQESMTETSQPGQDSDETPQTVKEDEQKVKSDDDTEQEDEPTTLVFTGDACFAYTFEGNYLTGGIENVVSKEMLTELQGADILMMNEEFPFSTRGTQAPDKQYTFRVDPKYVSAFTEMGVDIVSLANNHALDYGTEALEDSFKTLDDAGILYAGAGDTFERASQLQVIEVNGKKFGYLAASRVIPVGSWNIENNQPGMFCTYDETKLLAAIKAAKQECDFLTVYVHWGIERNTTPEAYQTSLGKEYIEAGADLVIGAHTHCLQGIQYFDGKPVFYSLGNFIFNKTIDKTAAVKVTVDVDGTASYQLLPASASNGTTNLLTGTQAADLYQYMESLSYDVEITEDGEIREKE